MRTRGDRGAAAVEMALILPLLTALLLGIVDFGFAFNAKIAATQAAREGVRVIALGGTTGEATTRVNEALTNNGQMLPASTSVVTSCTGGGDTATVEVSATVQTILPIPDITVTARGVMRCQG